MDSFFSVFQLAGAAASIWSLVLMLDRPHRTHNGAMPQPKPGRVTTTVRRGGIIMTNNFLSIGDDFYMRW